MTSQRLTRFTFYIPLFLFLLTVYLLTYTPRINSSDGLAMFATAESMARRGTLDIEQIRWMQLQQGTYGLDGWLYSRKGVGVPLGLLPLTWLGLVVPWFGLVSVSLLFNAIVTALTGVLLLAYLQRLGFSSRSGLIVALAFGLTTLAWPYAKSLFSDPFSGLLLLAAAYMLLKFSKSRSDKGEKPFVLAPYFVKRLGYPFLAGLFLGWNVATRYAEALFLPLYGLLLLYYLYQNQVTDTPSAEAPQSFLTRLNLKKNLPPIAAFSTPILLIGLALVSFNLSRYGDPLNTGYLPSETFSGILWQGIVGQLVSPGRGLLLYCPVFILSFWGLPAFFRRFRPEAILALAIIIIHLLLYGKWFMWHGGYAWGARFMMPTLPFWALFLAPVAARAFPGYRSQTTPVLEATGQNPTAHPGLRLAFLMLAGLGFVFQLLIVSIDFAPFLDSLLETGLPLFAPQTFFDPQYAPLLQAWPFVTLTSLDLVWVWQGQFSGLLLGALLINLGITGLYFLTAFKRAASLTPNHNRFLPFLAALSTLATVILLLSYAHTLPDKSLQAAVAILNESVRPSDAVITNDPEIAMPFAERYKGRALVLGLNNGGFPLPDDINHRLTETTDQHRQVWWLPNWLPPEESAIEQTLLTGGIPTRSHIFGSQRLLLLAYPGDLSAKSRPVNATFADRVALNRVAYAQAPSPGTVFPIELQWQGLTPLTEDYHVFVHLLTAEGQMTAQADGQPVQWTRPTSTWPPGEPIVDRYGLWLPPDTKPGRYHLRVGLYRPADGQRLSLSTGSDAVIFEVTIGSE